MAMNENVPGDTMMADRRARPSRIRLHPLHEAAMRIADIGLNRSKAKTRDLVGMLLTHGARAWRSTQPRAGIHLHVAAPGRSRPSEFACIRLEFGVLHAAFRAQPSVSTL